MLTKCAWIRRETAKSTIGLPRTRKDAPGVANRLVQPHWRLGLVMSLKLTLFEVEEQNAQVLNNMCVYIYFIRMKH